MHYPLEQLKVLDFSRVLAGPFAGRMLADLGADVVKVEPPNGDVTRLWGANIANLPGYYHQQNAGKRNICIDLRAPDARELVFQLVRQADLLIENYRPDVMPRLGLGYATLAGVNPRLIMLSISGFGQGGPESHRAAYAPIIHAEAGLMDRSSRRHRIPPTDLPLSIADTNASLHGLVGLLSAVILRERTGKGQHIDIAMLDATLATDDQLHYDLEGAHAFAPLPNDVFETGAGAVLISADFRYLWKRLTDAGLVGDPDTGELELEQKIRTRRRLVGDYLLGLKTWEQVETAMQNINIAWGRVRCAGDLPDQATVRHRGAIARVDDRAGGERPVTQSPYRFSAAKSGVRGPAPHRGEHNHEVLRDWLQMPAAQVDELKQKGVLDVDGRL